MAIAMIAENMEHPLSPQDIADAAGTSRRTLERLFLKFTGETPSKYCKTRRLEKARDLLLHSNMTILDIDLATGFRSGSYFSYSFSEYYKHSTSVLRQLTDGTGPL